MGTRSNRIKKRQSTVLFAFALVVGTTVFADRVSKGIDRPNVVVLLADDAGWGDYSQNGNVSVCTPNIDSLAKEGVTMDRFFVSPLCAPTRAAFLTGRYYRRTGVTGVSRGRERMNLDEKTLADAFRAAGYSTGAFGKWHNGSQWPYHPVARGFDEFFGYTSGHWGEYFDAELEDSTGRMVRTQGYIADVCTDRALTFIEKHRNGPFFLYVPFTTPHSPWAVPQDDWQRFKDKPIRQRATFKDREKLDYTRCALAMMENQDWNVGRILKRLEDLGLGENTIVVYFSDNGPNSPRWNGDMKGRKGSTDEGGVRSPCFIRWPARLAPGRLVEEISGAIDLLPTLTSLAGVKRVGDKPLDGLDLSPLLMDDGAVWPDRMVFSIMNTRASVRAQNYRMDNKGMLFDMVADPGQRRNIAAKKPEVATRLAGALKNFQCEMTAGGAEDERPIPVGFREFPVTMLPARDGEPRGGIKRSAKAPNCSYFINWTSTEGRMEWGIDVHQTGRYEVTIDYTCPVSDAGSLVELSFMDERLSGRVEPGWNPPLYTNRDNLPRNGESHMKEFRTLTLGTMSLKEGSGVLTLRALDIKGKTVMDVRRVTLRLLD